jgi:hypothetical protein
VTSTPMVSMNRGKFEIEKSHLGPYSRVLRRLQPMAKLLPDSNDIGEFATSLKNAL